LQVGRRRTNVFCRHRKFRTGLDENAVTRLQRRCLFVDVDVNGPSELIVNLVGGRQPVKLTRPEGAGKDTEIEWIVIPIWDDRLRDYSTKL
jgi:hypothetical protein